MITTPNDRKASRRAGRTRLTSSQAASLLEVHESSIKRWCNQGALPFSKTAGGHRRITLEALDSFSRQKQLTFPFASFQRDKYALCEALLHYQQHDNLALFLDLAAQRFLSLESAYVPALLMQLYRDSVPLVSLLEEVVCHLMHALGAAWQAGSIGVGEEHILTQVMLDALHALRVESQATKRADWDPDRLALVCSAEGSRHEIGAFCVRLLLEAHGWNVLYLGNDAPFSEVATLQQERRAKLVCISFVPPLQEADLRRAFKIFAEFAQDHTPYHLVVGGSALDEQDLSSFVASSQSSDNFRQTLHPFKNLYSFLNWLDQMGFSQEPSPLRLSG